MNSRKPRRYDLLLRHLLLIPSILMTYASAWGVTTSALPDRTCGGARATMGCQAGEFTVTPQFDAEAGTPPFCVEGKSFWFKVILGLSGVNTPRYNIGFYAGQEGNDPTATTAGNICSVATFPLNSSPPWMNSDNNACGDYTGADKTTIYYTTVDKIKVKCTGDSTGLLSVPYALSYMTNKGTSSCSGPDDVQNESPSKCSKGTSTVNGAVQVYSGAYVDVTKVTVPADDLQSFSFTATSSDSGAKVIALNNPTEWAPLDGSGPVGGTYTPDTIAAASGSVSTGPSTTPPTGISHNQTARFYINALSTAKTLTITETPLPTGWETTAAISCTNKTGSPISDLDGDPVNRVITASLSTTSSAAECTITNYKKPKVRIEKTSNNGTGTFSYTLTNVATTSDSIATSTAGAAVLGINNNYVTDKSNLVAITETAPAGWPTNPVSASCIDSNYLKSGNGSGSFGSLVNNVLTIPAANLKAGAEIVCSFVNTKPTVQVLKTSNNGTGSFSYALTNMTTTSDSITTTVAGTPASGIANNIVTSAATDVTITETAPAGWPANPASASCTDSNYLVSGNGSGSFGSLVNNLLTIPATNLKPAAQIVCDFVNTAVATITVNKSLVPAGDNGKFNLRVGGVAVATDVGDSGTGTTTVPANTAVTVDETAGTSTSLANYTTTYSCTGGYTVTNIAGTSINIPAGSVAPGSTTICTFTNIKLPTLTKAFSTSSIDTGQTASLIFTITNPAGAPARSGLTFTDTFPANLVIAGSSGVLNSCVGTPTITAVPGTGVFAVSGTGVNAVAGFSTCTISVDVTSSIPFSGYINGASQITAISGNLLNNVTDQTLNVLQARLTVLKSAFGVTVGATAKPGQDIPYQITVTNTGDGKAWEVEVADALSPYSAYKLNSLAFTDGGTSSGLSLAGSTTSYSYDNGSSWTTTPPVDLGGGYNGTVTNWRIVFDPAVQMNGNNAFFTISYQASVK